MLIHPLAERMRGLGLAAMADAFLEIQSGAAADDLAREDWLGLLLDREAANRENKRLGHRLRRIPPPNTVGDQAAALSAASRQFHGSSSCRCDAG